ncbi:hypothetical protein GEMRC1_000339 [Eukaryota sp. GEM-RC1]
MSLANILQCKICEESFNGKDRLPTVICKNQHTSCLICASSVSTCPFCRSPKLSEPVTNLGLLGVVTSSKTGEFLCEISENELQVDFTKPLGVGGSSRVYHGTWSNAAVAIKVVLCKSEKDRVRLRKELLTMFNLNHPCVLRVFGLVWLPENQLGIVMEKASASLTVPSSVSLLSLTYAKQIVEALLHLHSHNILHGDLKPENVLIVGGAARLSDFGTSKVLSETTTHRTNQLNFTLKYVAPEALSNTKSLKSDIYSLGLMLYELFCNEILFEGYDVAAIVGAKMCSLPLKFPQNIDRSIADLISSCCHLDLNERPSLENIYKLLNKLSEEFPKDCGSNETESNSQANDRSSTDLENLTKQNSELSDRVLSLQSAIIQKERELSESHEFSQNLKKRVSKLEMELQSSVPNDDSDSKLPSAPPFPENTDSDTLPQQDSEIATENTRLKKTISELMAEIESLKIENSRLKASNTSVVPDNTSRTTTQISSSTEGLSQTDIAPSVSVIYQSNLIKFSLRDKHWNLQVSDDQKTVVYRKDNMFSRNILGADPLLPGNAYTWKFRYRGKGCLWVGVIDKSKFFIDVNSYEAAHCVAQSPSSIKGCLSGTKGKWSAGGIT